MSKRQQGLLKLNLVAALLVLVGAASARAQDLGSARLQVAGTRLVVTPESQTVPFDTPTVVETRLEGYDPGEGVLPSQLRVLGELTGPEIDGVLTLETRPNQPFLIPRLSLKGEYRLDRIRLVQGEELLAYAEPRSAAIRVTQVLVTRVTSRALTLDEIRSYGIVADDSSFRAFSFTFGFAVDGREVSYDVPVLFDPVEGRAFEILTQAATLPGSSTGTTGLRFDPPRLAPFVLELERPAGRPAVSGGCQDPLGECDTARRVSLPGAVLFPTDVSLLNQFFSVVVLAKNDAPAGDPLTIRDLTARMSVPPGLRPARTEPPTPLGVPVPVRVPGPDGELGTADDLTFLVAQAEGQAEFLVEGLEEGTHVVQFDLEGVLEGLAGGRIERISGQARGAVVVRDPTLAITITHPETVRPDEEYSLLLTVSNTGNAPLNLVTVELPPAGLSGAVLLSSSTQTIPTLLPADSEVVEFRLRSLSAGRVIATSVSSGSQVSPRFELVLGVGELGIPLSPDAIVLPRSTDLLPPELVRSALALLGLGHSLATAPAGVLDPALPQLSRAELTGKIYQLAQAGRHVDLGEDLFDAVAVLAAEWSGAREADWEWDELRRGTDKGGLWGDGVGRVITAYALATSPRAAFDRFAATTAFLGPLQGALVVGSGAELSVHSRTSGAVMAGSGLDPTRQRQLPMADLYDLGGGRMALLARPEEGGYRVVVRDPDGGSVDLHLLAPTAAGAPRRVSFTGIALGAGGRAEVELTAGAGAYVLDIDEDGDGTVDGTATGVLTTLTARPFAPQAAVVLPVDPSGHIVEILFTGDVDLQSLLPRDPQRFTIPGKLSNGGLIPLEENLATLAGVTANPFAGLRDTRVVRVIFDNPISPYVATTLTVRDVASPGGAVVSGAAVAVENRLELPGGQVTGKVVGPDGRPVPFAKVELFEVDFFDHYANPCRRHRTAAVLADANGRFTFDYVRQTPCSDVFVLRGTDAGSGRRGEAQGRVRLVGQTQVLDVVMLGRGTIRGRLTYEDGSVPAEPQLLAYSPVFFEGRQARINAAGFYEVSDVPVGTVSVAATDRQGSFVFQTLEIPTAGSVVERDLVIFRRPAERATGDVEGVVYETDGVTPVFNAYIALYVDGELAGVERSDGDGRFDFGTVPAGRGEIEAFDGETGLRGAQVFFDIGADRVNPVTLLLRDDRGTVEGHVYRQNGSTVTPVAGAVVWVSGTPFNTLTGEDGSFRIEGVFAGNRTLLAADLATQAQTSAAVTVSAGLTTTRDLFFVEQLGQSGLAGEVLGFTGNPVPGATVHIAVDADRFWGETFTDLQGRFVFPDLPPGTYELHAFAGTAGGKKRVTIRFEGETPFARIQFQRGAVRGAVRAVGGGGQPVGVQSLVTYRTTVVRDGLLGLDRVPRTLETAPDGTFELPDALLGPYVLTVSNSFHGERTIHGELVLSGEVAEHEVLFEQNGRLRGRVLSWDGQTPAAGATVRLVHPNFSLFDLVTDQDGRFDFGLIPPTPVRFAVDVTHDDGSLFRRTRGWVRLDRPGQELDVDLVLPAQGAVQALVEDASGVPVAGAVVTLREHRFPHRQLIQNTDAAGFVSFSNIFAGSVTLSAQAPALGGLASTANATLTGEAEEVFVLLTLEATGEVEGRVLSPVDGQPVPSAQVALFRHGHGLFDRVTADEAGGFRFRLLPLAQYRVFVLDPATGRHGAVDGAWVEFSGHVRAVEVVLEARGEVDGHLTEPGSGVAVPGATLRMTTQSLVPLTTYSSTDGAGFFEFLGVPEGPFRLDTREPAGRRKAAAGGEITAEDQRVTVDLVLEASGRVVGTARNPLGLPDGPFANANVLLFQDGQAIGASLGASYTFEGIIAGRNFTLEAREVGGGHRGRATGRLTEQDQEVTVDVRLEPIGSLAVTVVDSFAQPVAGAAVSASGSGFYGHQSFSASTDAAGRAVFAGVGAGNLSAYATHPVSGLRGSASGTLSSEGEEAQVLVQLEDSGSVSGRVVLSDGATPAADALVVVTRGSRTLRVLAAANGSFHFPSVPLGSFKVFVQERFGPGTVEVSGTLSTNGQAADVGTLVLDDLDPRVLSLSPPSGSRDLPLTQTVTLVFSEPLDRARFGTSWFRFRTLSGTTVAYAVAWSDGDRTATLTPTGGLASFTGYEVLVQDGFDLSGRRLTERSRTVFHTRDTVAPTVIDVLPRDGQNQVRPEDTILLTFSEPVDPLSLSGSALQLTDLSTGGGVSTTFQVLPGERQARVTPVGGLLTDRRYRITVQGVRDPSGNTMAAPVSTTFWTLDTIPPVITGVSFPAGTSFTAGDGVPVLVTATDERGVAQTAVLVDGWRFTDTAEPWEIAALAPVVAVEGPVTLTIEATDLFGNVATTERTIQVAPRQNANPPTHRGLCGVDGGHVLPGISTELALAAFDDEAVEGITLSVDGVQRGRQGPFNTPEAQASFLWTPPLGTLPGTTFAVRLEARDFAGNLTTRDLTLRVPTGTVLVGGRSLTAADQGEELTLAGGTFLVRDPLTLASLSVLRGVTLTTTSTDGPIELQVAGRLDLQCGAAIDVTGLGYGPGQAPPWVTAAGSGAGGSHGGMGSVESGSGPAGEVYDSVYRPHLAGGGGAIGGGRFGGGVLSIEAGTVVLDGAIRARGAEDSSTNGGAGGSVRIDAGVLRGGGLIDASGGLGTPSGVHTGDGSGGGGRVALHVGDLTQFDAAVQVVARGGAVGAQASPEKWAAPGTVLVKTAGDLHGELIVDAVDDVGRPVPATALPALGSGTVVQLSAQGADAWLTGGEVLRPRWWGATVVLLDAAGGELGAFPVVEVDGAGRVLLAGAAGVSGSASYRGEYRFDRVVLRGDGSLTASDPLVAGEVAISGSGTLSAPLRATSLTLGAGSDTSLAGTFTIQDLTLESGAVLKGTAGQDLRLVVPGTLTVQAGALIDVTGLGYGPAQAPAGVTAAGSGAGGGHGGRATEVDAFGVTGEVYDSVYHPRLGGGGGGIGGGRYGGGVLAIEAGTVVLDGEIRARGAEAFQVDGGAGGTVRIDAAVLRGGGSIDASGGRGTPSGSASGDGSGGGGRVALYVDDLSQFDVVGQVVARGGPVGTLSSPSEWAGPGTVFVFHQGSTYGELRIDAIASLGKPVAETPLPALRGGVVGVAEIDAADPTDLWIEPQDPEGRFSLGVVGMWVRVDGVDYRVLAEDGATRRRVLLEDAAGAVAVGDAYLGVYKFDAVTVAGGAHLVVADAEEFGTLTVAPGSTHTVLDFHPPTLSLTSPPAGVVFASGDPMTLSAEASDDQSGVTSVLFQLGDLSFEDTAAPWEWSLAAPGVTATEQRTVIATATDGAGNRSLAMRTVTLEPPPAGDPPTVAITCPTAALAAPGTGLDLFVEAHHAGGIEKVDLLVGSDPTVLASDSTAPFVLRYTVPPGAADGEDHTLRLRARSFAGTTAEATLPLSVVTGAVFTANATLSATDFTWEGQSILVAGGTLTIDGPHSFRDLVVLDGAKVTHSATTTTLVRGLELALSRDLFVACGGSIDASGRGYLGSGSFGYSYPNSLVEGTPNAAGGSHGGRGGNFKSPARVYGNLFDPRDPGAGTASSGNPGGGVVRIAVLGTATLDGMVRADGAIPCTGCARSAGGSIRLDADVIQGTGTVSAAGGGATNDQWAGSGGRVALYGATVDQGLVDRVRVNGGSSTVADRRGAAGTLYVKRDGQALGDLILDNRGVDSTQVTELIAIPPGVVDQVTADGFTDLEADFFHSVAGQEVFFDGDDTVLWPVLAHGHHGQALTLDVSGQPLSALLGSTYQGLYRFDRVIVRGKAKVLTTARVDSATPPEVESGSSWTAAYTPTLVLGSPTGGTTVTAGNPLTVSATATSSLGVSSVTFHFGGLTFVDTASPFTWSPVAPAVAAPTTMPVRAVLTDRSGYRFETQVSVQVLPNPDAVAPAVAFGACPAEGDRVIAGLAQTIPVTLSDNQRVARYAFRVDGELVTEVYPVDLAATTVNLSWTPPVSAPGAPFVLTVETRDYADNTASASRTVYAPVVLLSGNQALGALDGQEVTLGAGTYTATAPLTPASLALASGAVLTAPAGGKLSITAAADLRVQCGAKLEASGLGYAGGVAGSPGGGAPAGVPGAVSDAGGSHGGRGTSWNVAGAAGPVYDSVYRPRLPGGGGALDDDGSGSGTAGGGVVEIEAGAVVLNGDIRADGPENQNAGRATGAGGTIWVRAGSLSGSGRVIAVGGYSRECSTANRVGSGGGGRVALVVDQLSPLDLPNQALVFGGARVNCGNSTLYERAAAGTVYVRTQGQTDGELWVMLDDLHAGEVASPTELPVLGSGSVTLWEDQGDDAWVTGAGALPSHWEGAWMEVLDGSGAVLDAFRVLAVDGTGRVLLEDAAGTVGAASYRGQYRFDRVVVTNGAGLTVSDPLVTPDLDLRGASHFAGSVPGAAVEIGSGPVATVTLGDLTAASLTVESGVTVRPPAGESVLRVTVSGDLTVESGAALSVDGLGYGGGTAASPAGGAPPAVTGPAADAGGSHGGEGIPWTTTASAGETYGSVYFPLYPGAGGAFDDDGSGDGHAGGGMIFLTADRVFLGGTLLARGTNSEDQGRASGAAGTVVIQAAELSGAGTINVAGGRTKSCSTARNVGSGGGGRVALRVASQAGFDPLTQVLLLGASNKNCSFTPQKTAGSGTLYRLATGMTHGELVVNAGTEVAQTGGPARTPLPVLGSGTVGVAEPDLGDPANLWIEPDGSSPLPSLGVTGMWVRVGGTDYRVLDQTADRTRLLLAGAAGLVAVDDAYQGVYKFDKVVARGGATVVFGDLLEAGVLDLDASSQVVVP
jgi:hypothetical protein